MFSPYKIELGLGLGTGNTGMNYFTEVNIVNISIIKKNEFQLHRKDGTFIS